MMTTTEDAKGMARALRGALAAKSVAVSHSQSLELVAQMLGCADWNTLSAAIGPKAERPAAPLALEPAIPILRIFDVAKAEAFYLELLGFKVDWRHRFEEGLPLYMQVSRGGVRLHLTEHHGDATPGSTAFIYMSGLDLLHAELAAKGNRAQIEPGPVPSMRVLVLWDPFGNRLRFGELGER